MSEVHLLIRQEESGHCKMTSVVESFTCLDLAELKCVVHNSGTDARTRYYVQTVQHNETESLQADYDGTDLFVSDEDDSRIYLKLEISVDTFEERHHEEAAPTVTKEAVIDRVHLHDTSVSSLRISDDLKRDIMHQAENICDRINEHGHEEESE